MQIAPFPVNVSEFYSQCRPNDPAPPTAPGPQSGTAMEHNEIAPFAVKDLSRPGEWQMLIGFAEHGDPAFVWDREGLDSWNQRQNTPTFIHLWPTSVVNGEVRLLLTAAHRRSVTRHDFPELVALTEWAVSDDRLHLVVPCLEVNEARHNLGQPNVDIGTATKGKRSTTAAICGASKRAKSIETFTTKKCKHCGCNIQYRCSICNCITSARTNYKKKTKAGTFVPKRPAAFDKLCNELTWEQVQAKFTCTWGEL